jgi:predicted NUDIX family NTP pyrophosphohydrolase
MAARTSAGLVLYRRGAAIEVLLGHMGGPYFARKDDGAWSIPKGEYDETERALDAARREFAEEIGVPAPEGDYLDLGSVKQRNGKLVTAWAVEGDFDPERLVCNTFELEWPPRSGRVQTFPELDRVAWFDVPSARGKALSSQGELFDRLVAALG